MIIESDTILDLDGIVGNYDNNLLYCIHSEHHERSESHRVILTS